MLARIAAIVFTLIFVSGVSLWLTDEQQHQKVDLENRKVEIKNALSQLKFSAVTTQKLMTKIAKDRVQANGHLNQQQQQLIAIKQQSEQVDNEQLIVNYQQWLNEYQQQVNKEGYYLKRAVDRINALSKKQYSMNEDIENIEQQNNELFNLFSPVLSQGLIQENDIIKFKIELQKTP